MPVSLDCFEEHHRMLQSARQLRTAVYRTFGPPAEDDPDFNDVQEIEDSPRVIEHLDCISVEMTELSKKAVLFSPEQRKEFQLLSRALSDIVSYRKAGWIGFIHSDIEFFIGVLENGVSQVEE